MVRLAGDRLAVGLRSVFFELSGWAGVGLLTIRLGCGLGCGCQSGVLEVEFGDADDVVDRAAE